MNRYENDTPRAAFGVAAVAMTALTIALAVVLPAQLASMPHEVPMPAPSVAPGETVIALERIEVIAVREQEVATAPAPLVSPTRKPQG